MSKNKDYETGKISIRRTTEELLIQGEYLGNDLLLKFGPFFFTTRSTADSPCIHFGVDFTKFVTAPDCKINFEKLSALTVSCSSTVDALGCDCPSLTLVPLRIEKSTLSASLKILQL